ncbi:MAG: hypothetical protein A3F77_05750 [Betaproteobacteria bacterium RIFCSPLOWO2_12_FULL_67_28]|nr:MAG: hypothetical protein A3F77_05750 [Betaproteobacteria bacterium RIFCSPLOWO2_12_FULL_67_28]
MFPRVLAVQDHGDERSFLLRRLAGDALQLADQVAGGVAAVPVPVLESDQVGEPVVAKEHHRGRSVGAVRVVEIAPAIVAALLAQADGENTFAARHPAYAALPELAQEGERDRALGGPHPPGRLAEARGVVRERDVDLRPEARDAAGISAEFGQRSLRRCLVQGVEIQQQGGDRMVLRRGG